MYQGFGALRHVIPEVSCIGFAEGQYVQGFDQIDEAGAEEQERGTTGAVSLQAIDRANQVRVQDDTR